MNRNQLLASISLFTGVLIASSASAEAPKGSTGECKDGTYSSAAGKSGACSGHGGVKEWFTEKKASETPAKKVEDAPAKSAPSATADKPAKKPTPMPTVAAPGGGEGKVWVNTSSKVYHCSKDKWYGKTKRGEYMSEADAKAKGNHADHRKACS